MSKEVPVLRNRRTLTLWAVICLAPIGTILMLGACGSSIATPVPATNAPAAAMTTPTDAATAAPIPTTGKEPFEGVQLTISLM